MIYEDELFISVQYRFLKITATCPKLDIDPLPQIHVFSAINELEISGSMRFSKSVSFHA